MRAGRRLRVHHPLPRHPDLWGYLVEARVGPHQQSWLHAASALGHVERIRFLCGVGADVEATNAAGDPPFSLAGTASVVKALLAAGAASGKTPLICSCEHVRSATPAIIRAFLDAGADQDAIGKIVFRNAPIIVSPLIVLLLRLAVNVTPDDEKHRIASVRRLLKGRCDPNLPTDSDVAPLFTAMGFFAAPCFGAVNIW